MTGDKTDIPASMDASSMEFNELFEARLKELEEGEIIRGRVVQITSDSVMIDIGYKSEGCVPLSEFLDKSGKPTVSVGDEINVLIEKREDESGYITLSRSKAENIKVWDEIIKCHDDDKTIEGTITQRVKGGFHASIAGVIAFLPGSQVDLRPVKNQDKLVGQTFQFKILKYNKRKNNVIVSRRAILEKEREEIKKTTLEGIHEDAIVQGTVKNITDYGAFIDLGGTDGLIHLTDLSWGKVTHPSQVLKIGDSVAVKVLKYNKEDGRISLGLKQTKDDPWQGAREKYQKGVRVKGRVVNITDYGVFVEIEDGIEGLVHISELSWTKLKHPSQKVKLNDDVDVVVLDIDAQNKKASLSIKQTEQNPWEEAEKKYPKGTVVKGIVKNITDFGVFIGIDDLIDGLVHISDITWKKIRHPSEVFKKGQEIEAAVVAIDSQKKRFSLSTRLLEKNPWDNVADRVKPGMTLEGRVTSIADFGAFVEIEPGLEGLVHVSELNRGRKKGSELQVNSIVEVEVLNVDPEDKKIGLSIRGVRQANIAATDSGAGGSDKVPASE